jgi:hypothetical protein
LGKRSTGTKRPSSNADTTARESPVLKQPVMGYAANKAQRDRLLEAGYLRVWTLGDGAESLKAAIAYARGRAGTLAICTEDGRVFGDTRKQVEAAMGMIEAAGLRIHDLADGPLCPRASQCRWVRSLPQQAPATPGGEQGREGRWRYQGRPAPRDSL